jgi:hypothetical protein
MSIIKKSSRRKTTPQKGRERVKSWIYAVMNPLIDAIRVERGFLKERNWTWEYRSKSLVSIHSLERYVESAHLPIFQDFFKEHPTMERKRKKHDTLRAELSEHCGVALTTLTDSPVFREKVSSALAKYLAGVPGAQQHPGGAISEADFPGLIAQYVLNHVQQLPTHYTSSRFWAQFGSELSALRVGDIFDRVDESGKKLEAEDARLVAAFDTRRSRYCKEYDIPAAPYSTKTEETDVA